ncbi:MAG: hypothetical protein NVSMB21_25870 [Vulcanimicrobiaceae bacterium]
MDMNSNATNDDQHGDDRHTIATYLSDMLALERHIAQPVEAQLKSHDHQSFGEAIRIVQRIKTVTDSHIAALEAQLKAVGGHAGSPVKSAWSALLGGGAAALNQVRKTKVSKSLRDDYTALGLSAISYTMLNTTALGLGDHATAQLAKRHLDDITPIIVDISKTMPTVVLQELRDDGENVAISAAQISEQQTGDSWSPSNIGGSKA